MMWYKPGKSKTYQDLTEYLNDNANENVDMNEIDLSNFTFMDEEAAELMVQLSLTDGMPIGLIGKRRKDFKDL